VRDFDYAAAADFLGLLFSETRQAVEIRTLPNEYGAGPARPLFTRDPDLVQRHCEKWDDIGRAVYFGVATRASGTAKGDRAHVRELPALWSDIDCYKLGISTDEAVAALLSFSIPPSAVVLSGGGVHAYWLLSRPLDVSQTDPATWPAIELAAVGALKQLAGVFAGDLAVCDLARVMRLPGTHNTKDGTLRACSVLPCSTWACVDFEELVEQLDIQGPLLTLPVEMRPAPLDNPWLAHAKAFTWSMGVDVRAELDAMKYKGASPHSCNETRCRVSSSLSARGVSNDEIFTLLMAETRRVTAEAGVDVYLNWANEEKKVWAQVISAERKFAPETGTKRQRSGTVIALRGGGAKPAPDDPLEDHSDAPPEPPAPESIAGIIDLFNSRYMVVNEDGRAIIYEPVHDTRLNRRYYLRITFEDLKRFHLNRRAIAYYKRDKRTGKQEPVVKTMAEIWLEHADRREYLGGVVFDPAGSAASGTLNLWQGFSVPAVAGRWDLLKAHIRDVICAGDPDHFSFLLGWMARLVQLPAEQGEVAVVMKGGEGTGKGTLARALLRILGQHGLAISNAKHLTGSFNGHLRDTVFLFADEAFWAGDKQHTGVLKALITEPFLTIEAKYQTPVQMPNFVHLMMASNEDWVVPASLDARRFFVLEVAADHANDHAYFDAIWAEMIAGGFEAMLFDLLNYDLSNYNHRHVPQTSGLHEQRKLSLPVIDEWWKDCLSREFVYQSRIGLESYFEQWYEIVSTSLLYESYIAFAKGRHERRPVSREWFGRYMRKQGAKAIKPTAGNTGEHFGSEVNSFGGTTKTAKTIEVERPPSYVLGSLIQARKAFEATTKLAIEWVPEDDPDPFGPPF
jgi:hypothetical protein